MKALNIKHLLIIFFSLLFIACGGPKSPIVVIIQSETKAFAVGDPPVVFKSYGAMLDYFSGGTIVVFKVDYQLLKQKGQSGMVYRIDKDLKLNKLETIDTSLSNLDLVKKYLYSKNISEEDLELEEIDLK